MHDTSDLEIAEARADRQGRPTNERRCRDCPATAAREPFQEAVGAATTRRSEPEIPAAGCATGSRFGSFGDGARVGKERKCQLKDSKDRLSGAGVSGEIQ